MTAVWRQTVLVLARPALIRRAELWYCVDS